jgi:hypothetical protein
MEKSPSGNLQLGKEPVLSKLDPPVTHPATGTHAELDSAEHSGLRVKPLEDVADQPRDRSDIRSGESGTLGLSDDGSGTPTYPDPLSLRQHKRPEISEKKFAAEHPRATKRKLKKFYNGQNELIDKFLQSGDEERLAVLDMKLNGPKIKIAIYGSSAVNFCLFVIQLYAAISTGSLALFATAADAFVRSSEREMGS